MKSKESKIWRNIKKYRKILTIFIICILISFGYLIMNNPINGLFGEVKKNNEILLKTKLGDQFVIVEKSFDFPELNYYIEVYHEKIKKSNYIAKIFKNHKDEPINIINIYESDKIRCYLLLNEIIYLQKGKDTFNSINLEAFPNITVEEYTIFIPVIKHLMNENEWKWIKVFGEFLVKSKDDYTIKLLKRYGNGEFLNSESQKIKESGYTNLEIQKFSNDIISKYNL
jgi:hypothetical protein